MKIKDVLLTCIAPLILMAYGWYLGQQHQSGKDIAGILMFITGIIGLVLALVLRLLLRKYSWHNKWFTNILTGAVGCGIVFALVVVYARVHG